MLLSCHFSSLVTSLVELPLWLCCLWLSCLSGRVVSRWVASPFKLLHPLSFHSGRVSLSYLSHWVASTIELLLPLSCFSHWVTSLVKLLLLSNFSELSLPTELPIPLSRLSSWVASLVKFLWVCFLTKLPLTLSYLSLLNYLSPLSYLSHWVISPAELPLLSSFF